MEKKGFYNVAQSANPTPYAHSLMEEKGLREKSARAWVEDSHKVSESFGSAVLEAVDEGLRVFGKSVRHVIYYHLEARHHVKREEIPEKLEAFHKALEDLYGAGAGVVEKQIAEALHSRLGLSFVKHKNWTLVDYVNNAKRAKWTSNMPDTLLERYRVR